MTDAELKQIAVSLELDAGVSTVANESRAGYWKRIAAAAESLAGASTFANESIEGYQVRAAKALEAISGTSGAEENDGEVGVMKRLVDALEVQAGAVGTGTLFRRFVAAALNAIFGPTAPFGFEFVTFNDEIVTFNGDPVIAPSGA